MDDAILKRSNSIAASLAARYANAHFKTTTPTLPTAWGNNAIVILDKCGVRSQRFGLAVKPTGTWRTPELG